MISQSIKTAHIINLDQCTNRWTQMKIQAGALPIPINRWPAIFGDDLNDDNLQDCGINFRYTYGGSHLQATRYTHFYRVVACFLSHRTLLEHLANTNTNDADGHLILEDDVSLSEDCKNINTHFQDTCKSIIHDWDMIYLDLTGPSGSIVSETLMKLESTGVNCGTHAYIVRHGALKTKILPYLKSMELPIDMQYRYKFSEWNCYLIMPSIVKINKEQASVSSIDV